MFANAIYVIHVHVRCACVLASTIAYTSYRLFASSRPWVGRKCVYARNAHSAGLLCALLVSLSLSLSLFFPPHLSISTVTSWANVTACSHVLQTTLNTVGECFYVFAAAGYIPATTPPQAQTDCVIHRIRSLAWSFGHSLTYILSYDSVTWSHRSLAKPLAHTYEFIHASSVPPQYAKARVLAAVCTISPRITDKVYIPYTSDMPFHWWANVLK